MFKKCKGEYPELEYFGKYLGVVSNKDLDVIAIWVFNNICFHIHRSNIKKFYKDMKRVVRKLESLNDD